jgi:hypothetical protein
MRWTPIFLVAVLASPVAAAESIDLDKVAGVYKDRFQNSLVDGSKFTSENILEIVKTSPDEAYFNTHLEFYNGHECELSGLAHVERDALVYRSQLPDTKGESEFRIRLTPKTVRFEDPDGNYRANYCGERGGFDGIEFKLSARRPIRYMKRLLASDDYKEAIAEAKGKK